MINYTVFFSVQMIPLAAFWSLIYFGRHELQPKTLMTFIGIWLVSLIAIFLLNTPSGVFPAIEAVLSIVLVLLVFGGDFKIR